MDSWTYIVLCSCFFFNSDAIICGSHMCVLREWLVTDCSQCCNTNAEPNSAILKRVICCPHSHDLAYCKIHCNLTNDQMEKKGLCNIHCQPCTTPRTITSSYPTANTTSLTATNTNKTTMNASTTSVPTITSTVSSEFDPVNLSSTRKPFGEKSTEPIACTTPSNNLKGTIPLLVSFFLFGLLVGAVLAVLIFCISMKKHKTVAVRTKTSVHRIAPTIPMYDTTHDKDIHILEMSKNTTRKKKIPNAFRSNLSF